MSCISTANWERGSFTERESEANGLPPLNTPDSSDVVGWKINLVLPKVRSSIIGTVRAGSQQTLSPYTTIINEKTLKNVKLANKVITDDMEEQSESPSLGMSGLSSTIPDRKKYFDETLECITVEWQHHLRLRRELDDPKWPERGSTTPPPPPPIIRCDSLLVQNSTKKATGRIVLPTVSASEYFLSSDEVKAPLRGHFVHAEVRSKISTLRQDDTEWLLFRNRIGGVVKRQRKRVGRGFVNANKSNIQRCGVTSTAWAQRRKQLIKSREVDFQKYSKGVADITTDTRIALRKMLQQQAFNWSVIIIQLLFHEKSTLKINKPIHRHLSNVISPVISIQRWWKQCRKKLKWKMSRDYAQLVVCRFMYKLVLLKRESKKPRKVSLIIVFLLQYQRIMVIPFSIAKYLRVTLTLQRWWRRGKRRREARETLAKLQIEQHYVKFIQKLDRKIEETRSKMFENPKALSHQKTRIKLAPIRAKLEQAMRSRHTMESIDRTILENAITNTLSATQQRYSEQVRSFGTAYKEWKKKHDFSLDRQQAQYGDLLVGKFRETVEMIRKCKGIQRPMDDLSSPSEVLQSGGNTLLDDLIRDKPVPPRPPLLLSKTQLEELFDFCIKESDKKRRDLVSSNSSLASSAHQCLNTL